jgi:16S rRNA (guanine966-N2)-methyltransferase
MRVIAGCFRGRALQTPTGRSTRPILDRVKAALFDWLGARLAQPGSLPPIHVLDLFAGGGSLGIEALSRGADTCLLVETDRAALKCLRGNIAALKLESRTRVVAQPAETARLEAPPSGSFDLIFLDPPYPLSRDLSPASVVPRLVSRLGDDIPAAADALLIWRHEVAARIPQTLPSGWKSVEQRTWGTMAITMFRRVQE